MPTYVVKDRHFGQIFIRGRLGPHCADCSAPGEYLCDWPLGNGVTCDRPMCEDHVKGVGPNMDYCGHHNHIWEQMMEETSS